MIVPNEVNRSSGNNEMQTYNVKKWGGLSFFLPYLMYRRWRQNEEEKPIIKSMLLNHFLPIPYLLLFPMQ